MSKINLLSQPHQDISAEVNHLYRHEYGKLVAVLTKTFGADNMELAEDVVQDAMLEALNQWSYSGLPQNPVGWIYKVAKNKAVNLINREKYKSNYSSEIAHQLQKEEMVEQTLDHIFSDQEVSDDQLRMMFTCCHPELSADSQIALTLKTLCGFSIPEISKAFLTSEENINKRLVRARKIIKAAKASFEVPTGSELVTRLSSILEVIYLLFNEGYQASSGESSIRFELCEEAIRLAEIVASNPNVKHKSQVCALLALMSLNAARFSARLNTSDGLLDLSQQDRSLWDKGLIQQGHHYLGLASHDQEVSIYHIMATISAHHCAARDFDATDWQSILSLYNHLIEIDDSPIVQLNRAVVLAKTTDAHTALNCIAQMDDMDVLKSYLPYYMVCATLHEENEAPIKAYELLEHALILKPNDNMRLEIERRMKILQASID
ncbi:MAG: sigma-70 family RNA polymerase sigma factor [Reichenbachiella sp.]